MADKKPYSSILDEMLDEREPSWEDVDLADAKKSGEKQLNRTYQYVNKKFIDELAEGVSHHTQLPSDSKSATLLNRLAEKDAAAPRLGSGYLATTRLGSRPEDYRNPRGDDASLFDEVTMDLGKAEGTADIRKRNRTDSEIKGYVHKLLNQGTPPAHVAAQLKKLGELELLDKKDNMGASYLNQNAGLLGLAYLEPNTFMDKNSPAYERDKVGSEEKPFCAHCNKDVTPEKRDANSYCPDCKKILALKPKSGSLEKRGMNLLKVTGTPFLAECIACHKNKIFGGAKEIAPLGRYKKQGRRLCQPRRTAMDSILLRRILRKNAHAPGCQQGWRCRQAGVKTGPANSRCRKGINWRLPAKP